MVVNTGSSCASTLPIATTPALAMTMSMSAEFVDAALNSGLQRREVSDVGNHGHHLAAGVSHQLRGFVRSDLVAQRVRDRVDIGADVHRDDVGALFSERDGVAAALAAGRPGDHGDGVVEFTHDGNVPAYSTQNDRDAEPVCHDSRDER